jgi:hypothetical protein
LRLRDANRDELRDAGVPDAFDVVRLGGRVLDEVRRRLQQETFWYRRHKTHPLYWTRLTEVEHLGLLAAYLLYLAFAVAVALRGRAPLRGHHPLGPALVAGTVFALSVLAR